MTYHVSYDHQCPRCEALYIPYDTGVPCPRCGLIEAERFDFIPEAVLSMRLNKDQFGTYTPEAWYVGHFGDHILQLLFLYFDGFEECKDTLDFEDYLDQRLARTEFGEQDYLGPHLQGITLRVREELGKTDPEPPPSGRSGI